jgi:hypothetical protein
MLIIIRGKVKIVAQDNTVIAILKEGSFFGEIGNIPDDAATYFPSCFLYAKTRNSVSSLRFVLNNSGINVTC